MVASGLASTSSMMDTITESTHQAQEEAEVETETEEVRPTGKKLRWKTVEIHEHPVIIGDNPSVLRGVPLTIDWTPTSCFVYDLDTYESLKQPRELNQLIMGPVLREQLLLQEPTNYTRSMILQAQRQAAIVRSQRRQTNQARRWDACHEQMEKLNHTVQRVLGSRPSKRLERAYLELHCSIHPATTNASQSTTSAGDVTGAANSNPATAANSNENNKTTTNPTGVGIHGMEDQVSTVMTQISSSLTISSTSTTTSSE
jgi:hypothetical protein